MRPRANPHTDRSFRQTLIACRYAEVSSGLVTIVGGGLDTFFVTEYPTMIGFFLIVRIVGSQEEMLENHEVSFRLRDPSLLNVQEGLKVGFQGRPNPLARAGWETGVLLPTVQELEVGEEGAYDLEINVNGESKHVVHFFVREPPTAEEVAGAAEVDS